MIGLGRMGGNMASRLLRGGHRVVVHNRSPEPVRAAEAEGAEGATTLEDIVARLSAPRVVWMMLPAGQVTEDALLLMSERLSAGDVLVDGGNSNYKDTVRRATLLAAKGIDLVDCGTSGGIWGLAEGYSLMVGGRPEAIAILRPALETLAPACLLYTSSTGWFISLPMIHSLQPRLAAT